MTPFRSLHFLPLALVLALAFQPRPLTAQAPAVLAQWKDGQVTEADWPVLAGQTVLENGVDPRQMTGPEAQATRYKVVRMWAEARITAQAAERAGHTISPAELERDWQDFVNSSGGEPQARERLKRAGLTRAQLMAQRKVFLAGYRWLEKTVKVVAPTDAEARDVYARLVKEQPETFRIPERWRVSHILLVTRPGMSESDLARIRARAEQVRALAAAPGADFAALARAHSGDTRSRAQGGALPPLSEELLKQLPEPFGKVAMGLKPGELSAVIRTASGFHIVRGGAKLPPGTVAYADAKPKLVQLMRTRRRMEAGQQRLTALLKESGFEMKLAAPPEPAK